MRISIGDAAANIQDTRALARGGLPLLRLRMTACWKKQLVSTFCVLGQHLPGAAAADELRAAELAEGADWGMVGAKVLSLSSGTLHYRNCNYRSDVQRRYDDSRAFLREAEWCAHWENEPTAQINQTIKKCKECSWSGMLLCRRELWPMLSLILVSLW